jgi:hypothetical protein
MGRGSLPRNITLDPAYQGYESMAHPAFENRPIEALLSMVTEPSCDIEARKIAEVHLFNVLKKVRVQLHTSRDGEDERKRGDPEYLQAKPVISECSYAECMLPRGCIIFQSPDRAPDPHFDEGYCWPSILKIFLQERENPIICELANERVSDNSPAWRPFPVAHEGADGRYMLFQYASPYDIDYRSYPISIRYKKINPEDPDERKYQFHSVSVPLEALSLILQ